MSGFSWVFVREQRFERMGAFAYSEEEGTYSATHYEDNVPAEVKQRRLDELMILQQDISSEIEADKVGFSERTNVPIEPKLSTQWFLKMQHFADIAL